MTGFAALRRFAQPEPQPQRCDMCAAALTANHDHLVEPVTRRLMCACGPCALLFSSREGGRFRRVTSQLERLAVLRLPEDLWGALGIPVKLAFLYCSSATGGTIAVYPSPAGPLEAPVPEDAWRVFIADNPALQDLEPDVEALLVNRVGRSDDAYRCSLDRCYHLIGLVRTRWTGMTGGPDLWRAVDAYFARLRAEAGGER